MWLCVLRRVCVYWGVRWSAVFNVARCVKEVKRVAFCGGLCLKVMHMWLGRYECISVKCVRWLGRSSRCE